MKIGQPIGPSRGVKRIAVVQSCYVPWKGFFDLIGRCDEYVIFDQAQYVKRHWHNRNRIKTPNGTEWITIPVISKSRFEQPIEEVEVASVWAEQHWKSLASNYARARHFKAMAPTVQGWFEEAAELRRLTEVNRLFLDRVAAFLGLPVRIVSDQAYPAGDLRRTARLIAICRSAGATHYLSGPSARAYLDEQQFADSGIAVEWMAYGPYDPYPQLHGRFEHAVTVLDALFNLGPNAAAALRPATALATAPYHCPS